LDFLALRRPDCKIYACNRSEIGLKFAHFTEVMMKFIIAILLMSIFTVIPALARGHAKQSIVSVQVHTEKSVARAGFKIKFVEMVEDSRCPEGTNCIWAGNAKVKIEVRDNRNNPRTFELNSTTRPTVADYAGYEIKLSNLTPRPAGNVRIDPTKYRATFEVTKVPGK
jgi:hypothetical protein